MEFLADHCFFVCGVEVLRRGGHDVIRASEVGLARASDDALVLVSSARILLIRPGRPAETL